MPSTAAVLYDPPAQSDLLSLSRSACTALASTTGDSHFADDQVVWGLARFLQTCGAILARQANDPPEPRCGRPER